MSTDAYREFTGKTVEEAIRAARDEFGVDLGGLDFEILTSGSRGVLGMGAEPARIIAAPRAALGGAAPKREAAESKPLPPPPADRGPRRDDRPPRRDDRPPRRDDHPPRREDLAPRDASPAPAPRPEVDVVREPDRTGAVTTPRAARPASSSRGDRRDRGPRGDDHGARAGRSTVVSDGEAEEVRAARSLAREREELQAAEASPEALQAGREILEQLMVHLGYDVTVEVEEGETNRLNVVGDGEEKEALGALIGRKGERLSALQHLVNLMLSRRMGEWTRVLVDVEDYRGRRERQLRELAARASERVTETGKMVQFEPMSALERRWLHLALRDDPAVTTQSIGEEPSRRVVVLPRGV
jgi:spoIIIJ-associated protein